jgi:peptidoglycan-associated lipoprotein
MHVKWIGLFAALLFVAACETAPDETATTGGEGGVSTGDTGTTEIAATDFTGPIPGSPEDFMVNVGNSVYFDLDKSVLRADARETLNRQAEWLSHYADKIITVEGHCDERGTREYNLALGERRAAAVKSYLEALGVDGSRIRTTSYGKERPYALGHNEAAWAQNRRGVSVVN